MQAPRKDYMHTVQEQKKRIFILQGFGYVRQ